MPTSMNFLQKLDALMEDSNLNKNTLSKACSIPYTTIDGWYKKGYEGLKITTLCKLSNFFQLPLDYWVSDICGGIGFSEQIKKRRKIPGISTEEIRFLLNAYDSLNETGKARF